MGFYIADNDIDALRLRFVRCLQHVVRLADAGAHAEEDLQFCLSCFLVFLFQGIEKSIGIGPCVFEGFHFKSLLTTLR